MSFGQDSATKDTTQSTQIPQWMSDAGQSNFQKAQSIANQPLQQYGGQRVADFNSNQQAGFDATSAAAHSPDTGMNQARQLGTTAANAGAQHVGYGSINDQTSGGGSLGSYMSPYVAGAVQPQIDAIQRQGDLQRNQIGAQAAGSGAFGDARQGVMDGVQMRGEQQNIGNAVGEGYQNAFNNAQQQKRGDMQGQYGAQNANAGYNEQALQRMMGGGQFLSGLDQSQNNLDMSKARAQLGIGDQQQMQGQQGLNNRYQDFLEQRNWPTQGLQLQEQALGQAPHNTTTTGQTTDTTDNSGSMFGSLLGTGMSMLQFA